MASARVGIKCDDKLYFEFKKIARKEGYFSTRLAQKILESGIKKWIEENKEGVSFDD